MKLMIKIRIDQKKKINIFYINIFYLNNIIYLNTLKFWFTYMFFRFSKRRKNVANLELNYRLDHQELFCKHSEKEIVSTRTGIGLPRFKQVMSDRPDCLDGTGLLDW